MKINNLATSTVLNYHIEVITINIEHMKKIYEEYAKVRAEKDELVFREEILKAEILDDLKKNNLKKAETSFGKFTIGSRKTWIYSDKIDELKEKLAIKQIREQEKGIAKAKETNYLVFTQQQS